MQPVEEISRAGVAMAVIFLACRPANSAVKQQGQRVCDFLGPQCSVLARVLCAVAQSFNWRDQRLKERPEKKVEIFLRKT